jgi:HEAT repeat protein
MTPYTPHTPRPTPHSPPPTPHGPSFDQSHFDRQAGDLSSEPPQPWAQKDPADSLYRLARQTLNRGEYRRASQLFGDITQRFPNSAYAADARYWRAFALSRIGGVNELRDALASLNGDGRRYYQASLKADAATLASRIRGALAQLGDARAVTQVEREAGEQGVPCDKEDAAVRIAALNSLGNLDHESTTPILKRILAKRDSCSASLRRNALFLLAKHANPEATGLIITSARNDADPHVRHEALRWLARMPGDEAIATLEEIVRNPGDESMRQSAVAALARSDSPRARQAIRNIIERSDVPESVRAKALSSIAKDESPDGGAYIRNVYPRLETPRLKLYAVRAVARIGGSENERWLLSIVRNQSEPLDLRSTALTYVGRSAIPIGDLVGMYDAAGDRPLRMRLISLYGSRKEPEAADKLAAIAKAGTDPEMRRMAISALSRKNDPRTRKLLLEILDK